jgi:hypothetical protein
MQQYPETFCAAVASVTCEACPLRPLGEAVWVEACCTPGDRLPEELAEELSGALLAAVPGEDAVDEEAQLRQADEDYTAYEETDDELEKRLRSGQPTPEEIMAAAGPYTYDAGEYFVSKLVTGRNWDPRVRQRDELARAAGGCIARHTVGDCSQFNESAPVGTIEPGPFADAISRELGADVLSTVARHGSAAEVAAMIERVRGWAEEHELDVSILDVPEARQRLLLMRLAVQLGEGQL